MVNFKFNKAIPYAYEQKYSYGTEHKQYSNVNEYICALLSTPWDWFFANAHQINAEQSEIILEMTTHMNQIVLLSAPRTV